MKKMLITGGSSGIGLACASEFSRDFEVITASRSASATFSGDLIDPEFRRALVREISPDIFINNAGMFGSEHELVKTFELNFVAAGELLIEFYQKMTGGHIINNVSVSSHSTGYPGIPYEESAYCASKAALRRLSDMIIDLQGRPVKVTSLEPAFVMTDMSNVRERTAKQHPKDMLTRLGIQPTEPEYVAKTIRWILEQPEHVTIKSMVITNTSRFQYPGSEVSTGG